MKKYNELYNEFIKKHCESNSDSSNFSDLDDNNECSY